MKELKRILYLAEKIKLLEEEIIFLKTLVTKINQELNPVPGGSGVKKDKLEVLVIKLIEKENQYYKLLNVYQSKRARCLEKILKIENPNEMKVIYQRYILGKNLTEIAEDMNYSYKWIQTLHSRGVSSYKNVI